jgi:L-fuconolactonase
MTRLIVDGQCHLYEADTPERPWAMQQFPWMPLRWTAEDMLQLWDENGVSMGCTITPFVSGWDNSLSIEYAETHPDRIFVFGRFDGAAPDARRRLLALTAQSRNVVGLRITPYEEPQRRILFEEGREFWEAVAELNLPVAIYAPLERRALLDILERVPGLTLLIDHMGLNMTGGHLNTNEPKSDMLEQYQLMGELAQHDRVFVKLSDFPRASVEPYPFPDLRPIFERVLGWFGAQRIVYASDYPAMYDRLGPDPTRNPPPGGTWTYYEGLHHLDQYHDVLNDADLDAIMGTNLLGIIRESQAHFERRVELHSSDSSGR